MTTITVWVVAVVTARADEFEVGPLFGRRFERPLRLAVVSAFACAAAIVALALLSPPPLKLAITSVETNGQLQGVWKIQVEAKNTSSHRLHPFFATNSMGQMTTFWHVVSGPQTLAPGEAASYTLTAPNVGSMPGITTPFLLQAVTDKPASISSAPIYTPQHFSAFISPSYVDRVVPANGSVILRVGLRSTYGGDVHKQGIRVALGQVIYAEADLIPSEAKINNAPDGASPVYSYTNKDGYATFTIRMRYPQVGYPVYFQAWVEPRGRYPFGYSEVESVIFRGPRHLSTSVLR